MQNPLGIAIKDLPFVDIFQVGADYPSKLLGLVQEITVRAPYNLVDASLGDKSFDDSSGCGTEGKIQIDIGIFPGDLDVSISP